jgi:4-amino-4-deoxy-L-arabinose transferase-like glycosyltransferase
LIPLPIDFAFQAMAERSDRAPSRWRRPLLRWLDGVEAGWAVPLLIACFVVIWTLYLVIAYAGSGLHPDTLEAWTLGRNFAFGYYKHPPLMGWIAAGWTAVFPLGDWSLQLMAMVNAGLALVFVDCVARQFVTGHKRILVLLLLMLTPAYQFHAQRFNANAVLLATWPLATWCFLRAFETKSAGWAVAVGCSTALAMVGKYYSIFLVTSFAFAALAHPARRAYFSSASPWISVATGLAVLSPHLYWLATTGASTFTYALNHANGNVVSSLGEVKNFLAGTHGGHQRRCRALGAHRRHAPQAISGRLRCDEPGPSASLLCGHRHHRAAGPDIARDGYGSAVAVGLAGIVPVRRADRLWRALSR